MYGDGGRFLDGHRERFKLRRQARGASEAAAKCVAKCVTDGAKYVLVSKGKVYSVEPQEKFADFAGKSVKVTGSMSGDAITADTVEAAASHEEENEDVKRLGPEI